MRKSPLKAGDIIERGIKDLPLVKSAQKGGKMEFRPMTLRIMVQLMKKGARVKESKESVMVNGNACDEEFTIKIKGSRNVFSIVKDYRDAANFWIVRFENNMAQASFAESQP